MTNRDIEHTDWFHTDHLDYTESVYLSEGVDSDNTGDTGIQNIAIGLSCAACAFANLQSVVSNLRECCTGNRASNISVRENRLHESIPNQYPTKTSDTEDSVGKYCAAEQLASISETEDSLSTGNSCIAEPPTSMSGTEDDDISYDELGHMKCPLHIAVLCGDKSMVRELVGCGENVNRLNSFHVTPLSAAIRGAMGEQNDELKECYELEKVSTEPGVYREIVSLLLELGADPNYCDAAFPTPLQEVLDLAQEYPCPYTFEIAEELIRHGADVNRRSTNRSHSDRFPLLTLAIAKGSIGDAQWLIKHNADVNAEDKDNRTPLHHAVRSGIIELIKLLLKKDADTNIKDKSGSTPIFYAWSLSSLKLLLEYGASATVTDNDGDTVVKGIGCRYWNEEDNTVLEAIPLLEEHGVDISRSLPRFISGVLSCQRDQTPKYWSTVWSGLLQLCETHPLSVEQLREFLFSRVGREQGELESNDILRKLKFLRDINVNVDTRGYHGESLLHIACEQGKSQVIHALIKAGMNINAQDRFGVTAMHLATKDRKCFHMLIDEPGTAYSTTDRFGSTPLHWAILRGTRAMVYALMANNTDPDIQDNLGRKPRELPLASHWVLTMLQQHSLNTSADSLRNICSEPASIVGRCRELNPNDLNEQSLISWREHLPDHHQDIQRFAEMVTRSPCMGLLLDVPDNKDIVSSIMSILQSVAEQISREDPRLTSSVMLTGSNRDKTKVIAVDEIDAMFILEAFKGQFEIEREKVVSEPYPELRTKLKLKDKHDPTLQDFVDADFCLNGAIVNI